jgi:hypothetical protein
MMSPERVFPCDCCGEGIVITTYPCEDDRVVAISRDGKDEDHGVYYIELSFWTIGNSRDKRLDWKERLRAMWYIWKHGHPWVDMVAMTPSITKSFTNHLLYRVSKMEKKIYMKKSELRDAQ